MNQTRTRVCPVEHSGSLDNILRRWVQNPKKILGPFIRPGMSVMDFGCGPGFFTIDLARMVGPSGQVIAVDLQEGMLRKLSAKVRATELEQRIRLHRCGSTDIGIADTTVDFVLAFYMVHEIPDQDAFLGQLFSILRPDGTVLVVEPPVHVSRSAFSETLRKAQNAGFKTEKGPRVLLSKTAILKKA